MMMRDIPDPRLMWFEAVFMIYCNKFGRLRSACYFFKEFFLLRFVSGQLTVKEAARW